MSWLNGVSGESLYPEYWNDPNIAICPSDSRADYDPFGIGGWGIERDFGAQIARLGQLAASIGNKQCLNMYLSMPVSYIYNPYSTRTASQYLDTVWIRGSWWTAVDAIDFSNVGDLAAAGCPALGTWVTDTINVADMNNALITTFSPRSSGFLDDEGQALPDTYTRLREGGERFMITDINNAAASAKAQSQIFVMYDTWADNKNSSQAFGVPIAPGAQFFNHIPGGSNVLYMDGHVEFVRYKTKAPVITQGPHPMALVNEMSGINWVIGGHG